MDVIVFSSAIVTRDDGLIVIALFDGDPPASLALLRASETTAQALVSAIAEVLGSTPNDRTI